MSGLISFLQNLFRTKWLPVLILFQSCAVYAQENILSLEEVYRMSEQNYPSIKQKGLILRTRDISIENLNTGFWPQVSFNGQGSYQSDVTSVKIPIPGVDIPVQPKKQYKGTADINQLIFDGGIISDQRKLQELNASVAESTVDVELYQLKNRINQIYFSILYQDELLRQTGLLINDVQIGINKVKPQVDNGTVLRSNLQVLQVQLLQTQQRAIEIKNTRKGLLDALSLFIQQPLNESARLIQPAISISIDTVLNRPEIKLYENQSKLADVQRALVNDKNIPKISAFFQGGYGRPGLNLLSPKFAWFYITGVRLNWSFSGLYTSKKEKELASINQQTIELQKETFVLNTEAQLKQQKAEIDKYAELVRSDKEILELRDSITESAKAQLDNAVITGNDYLREINAADQARQALVIHQLQLLQAQINYAIIAGKL